jgi:serine/threonine protein kinase
MQKGRVDTPDPVLDRLTRESVLMAKSPNDPRVTPPAGSKNPAESFEEDAGAEEPLSDELENSELPTIPPDDDEPGRSPTEPNSLVGQTFGDFEILEQLGRGGMGVVYKARQKSLDRLVAMKMLLSDYFSKPVRLQRFLAEARAAARLAHPNIVNVYQVGECFAGHYFVMEYIDGPSLDVILDERRVPIPWAVSLLIPVADAVHYAHSRGIIHRDLKPSNIMIDRKRRPVVMDFGLAKFVGKSAVLTQEGVVMGTPAYMPPEQAHDDGTGVGPTSDVYSLGAILYHLLTGRPPYFEKTALKTVMKLVAPAPPAPVHEYCPDVPGKLEHVCMKCLRKEPDRRYQSAAMLARRLRQISAVLSPKQPASSGQTLLPTALLVARATGKQVRLFKGTTIIGRSADCDVILRAADVSKRHCQITLEGEEAVVEDLTSANGTSVNGRRVDRATLSDGDTLTIAGHTFEVQLRKPKR